MTAVSEPRPIRRLDEAVVNRIAAGEVIQRPANALKELLENCLDAGATSIQVAVKEGGLKLLQIADNGSGIRRDDMDIVCERFTTSKLTSYDDLGSIATYGFRGEALASITHIAHVAITTRTADSKCAYRGAYVDGKLKDALKPCAGNVGTQIVVEDLFYNVPTRRRALRSAVEEHQKIVDVVTKYAVHNARVGFSLKKDGGSCDVKTPLGATAIDNIRAIYGPAITRELLEVSLPKDDRLAFAVNGLVSNANYSTKKPAFLLFINHRLVDSTALRRAMDAVYAAYLPKHTHPFIYLSLEIAPRNVDVNVHPTKHEVQFLHEDAVVEAVQRAVDARLLGTSASRTFYIQGMLPSATAVVPAGELLERSGDRLGSQGGRGAAVAVNQVVRTDCRERKMEAFWKGDVGGGSMVDAMSSVRMEKEGNGGISMSNTAAADKNNGGSPGSEQEIMEGDDAERLNAADHCCMEAISVDEHLDDQQVTKNTHRRKNLTTTEDDSCSVKTAIKHDRNASLNAVDHAPVSRASEVVDATLPPTSMPLRQPTRLTSVLALRRDVDRVTDPSLRELIAQHSFVGCVTPSLALVQHRTRLYLANTSHLSREFFRQRVLSEFGNAGVMRLSEGARLRDLASLALDLKESGWTPTDGAKDELARFVERLLTSKAEMLRQYFSLEIDDEGRLCGIPLLLDRYVPALEGLPMYVLRLATEVDWDSESDCFDSFARETAAFYAITNDWLLNPDLPAAEGKFCDGGEEGGAGGGESVLLTSRGSAGEESSHEADSSLSVTPMDVCGEQSLPGDRDAASDESLFSGGKDGATKSNETSYEDSAERRSVTPNPGLKTGAGHSKPPSGCKSSDGGGWKWVVEHVVYPALRAELLPPRRFSEDGTLLQIANLPDLYKVFERC